MSKWKKTVMGLAGTVMVAVGFAIPSIAVGHPSVYQSTANTASGTPPTLSAGATRYVIGQHGFTRVLEESNGATTNGVLNFMKIPGAWRNAPGRTKAEWFAQAATGLQVHATCQGVAQLDEDAILAWQGADPVYPDRPGQKTASGLDALANTDPAETGGLDDWLSVIQTETGVDLAAAPDVAAACTNLGGTYVAADNTRTQGSSFASGDIANAVEPLQILIGDLELEVTGLDGQVTALEADLAEAEQALAEMVDRPMVAMLSTSAFPLGVGSVMVSGAFDSQVSVAVEVSEQVRKRLKLASRTIGQATASTGATGAAMLVPKAVNQSVSAKLRGKRTPVTVRATLGDGTWQKGATVTG
ncbi:MAG: hypothetical protein ACKORA_08665 [Solirubrobacterales bacterium]